MLINNSVGRLSSVGEATSSLLLKKASLLTIHKDVAQNIYARPCSETGQTCTDRAKSALQEPKQFNSFYIKLDYLRATNLNLRAQGFT